jgi:hypothetical protein
MRKLAWAFLCFPFIAKAQNDDSAFIKKIADNILTSRSAYNNLYYLSKNIGGRLAGSPGMVKAEQWGAKVMKENGGENVFLQQCMVPHWVRGGKDKATATYTNTSGKTTTLNLEVLALGNSVGTGEKGVNAPVIRVNSFDDLEAKKDQLKGKIVFYNVPFEETFIETFKAYGKNVIYRVIGASRAAKYGAVAVIVRSMTNAMDNRAHTGTLVYMDSIPQIPAVALGVRDVEKLDTLIDNGAALSAQIFTYGKMLPDTIGHNVVGEIKGSEHPEQVITVGGHLDSWDVNEGTSDDGTGIIHTLEILRVLKALGYQPKHTIRFVFFANEENGGRGGDKYAEEIKAHNEQPIFAMESDAGGFTPRGFSLGLTDAQWNKVQAWKPLLAPYYGDRFVKGGGGADIEPLGKLFNTPLSELMPDTQRYFDMHHSYNDVFEFANIREVQLGAINMAAFIYLVDKYGL